MNTRETQQQILQYIESTHAKLATDSKIAEQTNLDVEKVRMHLTVMEKEGYVNLTKTFGGWFVHVTAKGKIHAEEPEYNQTTSSQGSSSPAIDSSNRRP